MLEEQSLNQLLAEMNIATKIAIKIDFSKKGCLMQPFFLF